MNSQTRIWVALAVTLFFLGGGTIGYMALEGYTFLDGLYMSVITISTVGYGEVQTLSEAGRIFTIFLILCGIGSLAFAIHAVTETLIERAWQPGRRRTNMEKMIKKLRQHYIICGHGRVGAAAAKHFHRAKMPFVIIEESPEECKVLIEKGYHFLEGDGTREDVLLKAGIKAAGGLLALLNSDPDNLFTVLTARELNPTLHIIARSEVESSEVRILRAGADSIISPYASAGKRVADKVLDKTQDSGLAQELVRHSEVAPYWIKVGDGQAEFAGKTVGDIAHILKVQVLGLRRDGKDSIMPLSETVVEQGEELLLATCHGKGGFPCKVIRRKIVLVDDNPVIRRLYTRLFQKAGFNIATAKNGSEGYERIIAERPDAAVIDLRLPDISGLDLCRQLKANDPESEMKIVLFTADEHDEVKKEALAAGVDTVVVKSPDAEEIIATVVKSLA